MDKKRKGFLNFWLWFLIAGNVVSLLYSFLFTSMLGDLAEQIPNWLHYYTIVAVVINFFAIYNLFKWKKIGFNIILLINFIGCVISIVSLGLNFFMAVIPAVISVGVLYLAMKPQWSMFK